MKLKKEILLLIFCLIFLRCCLSIRVNGCLGYYVTHYSQITAHVPDSPRSFSKFRNWLICDGINYKLKLNWRNRQKHSSMAQRKNHEFTFELAWFDVGVTSDICVIFPKSAMLTKNIYTMAELPIKALNSF